MQRVPIPPGVRMLDVEMFGVSGISCSYVVDASEPILVETGPTTVFDTVVRKLEEMQVEPKHVVVSHIHLDHSGGAGHIARAFPGATIWVHEIGAKHVVDPTRLIASARRIFGDALESLWGEPDPVPESRVKTIDEGTVIRAGDRELRVLYTPGHANHEVTLYEPDSGAAFVGDTCGLYLTDAWQKPASPPPEWDYEAALDSIERVRGLRPSAICFTHYGPAGEPSLDRAAGDIRKWDAILRPMVLASKPMDELVEALAPTVGAPAAEDEYLAATEKLSALEASISGYVRYYQKRYMS